MELWKCIDGFKGQYQVSDLGRVRSVDRETVDRNGIRRSVKGKILSPCDNGNGYKYVSLGRGKREYIHRLVARAFVCNPHSLQEVNHINEIKSDNRAENLEWVTHLENIRHGTGIERGARNRTPHLINGKSSKPVVAISAFDKSRLYFPSISEASRQGFDAGSVIRCCRGERKAYKGYMFSYA